MLVKVNTAALNGLKAMSVTAEVNAVRAEYEHFAMVGLPDNAVRESQLRVKSALLNSGLSTRYNDVTVNFAPADVRKEGSGYDLPLAIGLLAASKMFPLELLADTMFVGELGLDGHIHAVRGALPVAILARSLGFKRLIVPRENAREAAVVNRLEVYGADTLKQVVDLLKGCGELVPTQVDTRAEFYAAQTAYPLDFADVKGQEQAKRACEIAAAGGHNILFVGSPGCGKSMIAKRMPSILPQLTLAEALETTQIHSIAGKLEAETSLINRRPFRAPHHTITDTALIGGGTSLQPGEISLAHNGVLFLDELPEYSRSALETMRQPLEDRVITISRTKYSATLPCSFMLVAAMNPCPCGYYHHPTRACNCNEGTRKRYMNRVSGPLLDRIDIQLEVEPVSVEELAKAPQGEPSSAIRERVVRARAIQSERFKDTPGVYCNAQMSAKLLEQFAKPDDGGAERLAMAMKRLNLSARAYERILKVARTIADLDGSPTVRMQHIGEAVSYRSLDRENWGE